MTTIRAFLKKAFRLLVVDTTPSSFSLEAFFFDLFQGDACLGLSSRVDDGFLLFGGLFLPSFLSFFLKRGLFSRRRRRRPKKKEKKGRRTPRRRRTFRFEYSFFRLLPPVLCPLHKTKTKKKKKNDVTKSRAVEKKRHEDDEAHTQAAARGRRVT
jgi:hypothetical protein